MTKPSFINDKPLLLVLLIVALSSPSILLGQNLDSLIQQYLHPPKQHSNQQVWQDMSAEALQSKKEHIDMIHSQLATIDQPSSIQERINYDLLKVVIDDEKYDYDWKAYLLPLNSEGGFLANIIYRFNGSAVTDDESKNRYFDMLEQLPAYLDQHRLLLSEGVKCGKVSPQIIVTRCIELMDYHLEKDLSESLFFSPVVEANKDVQNKASQLLQRTVVPAYRSFRDFLEDEYLPKAPQSPGIGHLNDGMAYYEHKVRFFTTLDMTPDEVFNTGQKEVARIRERMEAIIEGLNFDGDFNAFLEFLRTDEQFYVDKPHQLLHYAAWLSKTIEAKLPKYFNILPRNPFTVEPVPDALAPNYTGGRYSPGSYNTRKAGAYWVNTYNLKSRPLYVMPALTLHEAVPGHHLQGSIAQEIELTDFRRNTYLSAFGEGWALYTEFLGEEMGIYTTPYEEFGRLTYEMWRACRLVVDVGLHYKGWTRQQAIDFLADNTALSILEVTNEIDRYIGWPGQAVSYKIGELHIKSLRSHYEGQLNNDFDLPTFHDNLLKYGAMPLATLTHVMSQCSPSTDN